MSFVILDIETIPDGDLIQKIIYPQETSLTYEEAVERYQKKILEDSNQKKDFIPYTFHVPISLAVIRTDQEGKIEKLSTLDRPDFRPHQITKIFWDRYEENAQKNNKSTLVTFNGRGFDLPVLELSAFRYGVSTSKWFGGQNIYAKPRYRYSHTYHWDIMEFITNYGANYFVGGLNLLATLLGKPGKMNIKGSEVYKLWREDKKIDIDDYCLCDALDTYFVFLRLQVLIGQINLEKENELVKAAHEYIEKSIQKYSILQSYLENFTFWANPYQ